MRHRAAPHPLALAAAIALAVAQACGRDEAVGGQTPSSDAESGGAAGAAEQGDGGLAGAAAGTDAIGGAGPCESQTLPDDLAEPAHGLSLKQISVLQAVTVPIMEQMIAIESRPAQLVSGRPGLVRVFVKPAAEWRARSIRARLTLGYGDTVVSTTVYEQTLFVEQTSEESHPSSSFNFEVPAEAFEVSTHYSVELFETESCTSGQGDSASARFPAQGTASLGVLPGQILRVRIVPVALHVGDEVFLPDFGSQQLELLRREVVKLYPVRDVELSLRDSVLSSTASDMVGVLEDLAVLRDAESTDGGLSYYGMVQFGPDLASYCSPSCVLGASTVGDVPGGGEAVGIGYTGSKAALTFAHELGHVYGRPHSPCGVAGDPAFPYAGGGVGGWGYDIFEALLVEPTLRRDFMGYCSPTWVSDHTYEHLRQFIDRVAAAPLPAMRTSGARSGLRRRSFASSVIRCGEP